MSAPAVRPPARIETARLVLRAWEPADAPQLKGAIDRSLAHLQAWMPWARDEPSPVDAVAARLGRFAAGFAAGAEWLYGVFAPDGRTVLGGTGLHPRVGSDGLEIGYWIAADATRRGYASEAAHALAHAALRLPGVERVEIRCDARNVASAGVPARIGFAHVATFHDPGSEAGPRETMVWRLSRADAGAAAG